MMARNLVVESGEEHQSSHRKKVSQLHTKAKREESARMKIPEEGVIRNTRRRLGMEELSMVFTNKFVDSTCCCGLCATHIEQDDTHRRRKFDTAESHSKGSERSHNRSS